jgi:thiamine pyrophosphate-dependent acetolactate synthase large subunit-like protein
VKVEQDHDATLAELCAQLEQQVKIRVSPSTLCRTLQQLNLTRKKTLHASQAETDRVQLLRREYREEIRAICPEDLVFIAETGVNLIMVRLYARALKGERTTGGYCQLNRPKACLLRNCLIFKG